NGRQNEPVVVARTHGVLGLPDGPDGFRQPPLKDELAKHGLLGHPHGHAALPRDWAWRGSAASSSARASVRAARVSAFQSAALSGRMLAKLAQMVALSPAARARSAQRRR